MGSAQLTYRELVDRIDRVSNGALNGLGLAPGDHTALMAPNCLEFIEIVMGLAEAGTPAAMVNPKLTGPELAYICDDARARVLFVHESLAELARSTQLATVERIIVIGAEYERFLADSRPLRPAHRPEEWDTFCLPYTAGTTGRPKGVMLPHRARALTFFAMAVEFGCYSPDDRALATAPLFHGAGFTFSAAALTFGGYAEIGPPKFDPEEVLRLLRDLELTNVFLVPTHFNGIFALSERELGDLKPARLRTIMSNAAPLPQATKEKIVDYFGDGLLHELYGSTEGGIISNLRPPDQLRKIRCVGKPFPATLVRLLDDGGNDVSRGEVGELYSTSPYLFNGYWGRAEETAASFRDEWFSAGDMAVQDEEGYLYLVDRKQDLVISGGVNIYPRELEEVLCMHPAVLEAAAVGLPDAYWGEAITAFVVLNPQARVDESDLLRHCEQSLARFKLPKAITFVAALPRNAAGKVLKTELRKSGPANLDPIA